MYIIYIYTVFGKCFFHINVKFINVTLFPKRRKGRYLSAKSKAKAAGKTTFSYEYLSDNKSGQEEYILEGLWIITEENQI